MITLRTLGTVDLADPSGAADTAAVRSRPKTLALLIRLAVTSREGPVRRDTLLALFWPELPEDRARRALSQTLYTLRSALGGEAIVASGSDDLRVAREEVACDACDFLDAVDEGRHVEALELYGGDFLPGFHLSGCPDFDRWLHERREEMRRTAVRAALELAEERAEEGDAIETARSVRWALAHAPHDEGVLQKAMRLLDRTGNRTAALSAYGAFVTRLREEMEIEPTPETQALVRDIRSRGERHGPGGSHLAAPRGSPAEGAIESRAPVRGQITEEAADALVSRPGGSRPRPGGSRRLGWSAPVTALLLGLGILGWSTARAGGPGSLHERLATWFTPDGGGSPPLRMTVFLEEGDHLRGTGPYEASANAHRPSLTALAFSPDGSSLVFAGQRDGVRQLFRYPLATGDAIAIPGTEGAEGPFFSPDGLQIGFWSRGFLRRVAAEGDTPVEVARVARFWGASWGDDGYIVFRDSARVGLSRVPATGGPVESLPSHPHAHLPHVLPGSGAVLYTTVDVPYGGDITARRVELLSLGDGVRDTLVLDASDGRYLPTGHLVFARAGSLLAVEFDLETMTAPRGPRGLLPDVMHALNGGSTHVRTDAAQYAVSAAGHLAYLEGGITPTGEYQVAWVDLEGRATLLPFEPRGYLSARISPEGRLAAVSALGPDGGLWVLDLARGETIRPIARGSIPWALWTPDGDELVYLREDEGLFRIVADGSSGPRPFSPGQKHPAFWSMNGEELFFIQKSELHALSLATGAQRKVLSERRPIWFPALSPDGRWLAYRSGGEIVVRPFPSLDERWVVSVGLRARDPRWSPDGSKLYYSQWYNEGEHKANQRFVSVDIDTSDGFSAGPPREHFRYEGPDGHRLFSPNPIRGYDLTPDGERLLVLLWVLQPERPKADEIQVVLNWFGELEELGDHAPAPEGRSP